MFEFGKDDAGNVAIVFALSILPTIGMAGAAVDYSRATAAREFIQKVSDRAAVAVVSSERVDAAVVLAAARGEIEAALAPDASAVEVTGRWLDGAHYAVSIEMDYAMRIVQAVPAAPRELVIGVETVTRRIPPTYVTTPPTRSLLEPEAADYNRIYLYCYDASRADEPDRGRRGAVAIADNATPPTDYSDAVLPVCGPGEVVGYMLRNVRNARAHPSRWDDPTREVYEYWADPSLDHETRALRHEVGGYRVYSGGVRQALDMRASPILETVSCRTDAECVPASQGGVIPNRQTNRTPQTSTQPCREGEFLYYGWEDRPPGFGWTDRDYDDIRLVVSCPVRAQATQQQVMIVR